MTDLEIYFQEAVLTECDRLGVDANTISEKEWGLYYDLLTEANMESLVTYVSRHAAL